ncbi:MAG: hypothetical protein AAF725_07905 [Acidobacteriota bacterium]
MQPTLGNTKTVSLLALSALLLLAASSGATVVAGGEASVWDSDVPQPAPPEPEDVLFPIGGSGQVNGAFILETVEIGGSALQVGLRAQERFIGPVLPRAGTAFFAESGSPNADGRASWNYEIHLDFGTSDADTTLPGKSLESQLLKPLEPLNMRDFTVEFQLDTDPSAATSFVTTDLNESLDLGGAGPEIRLLQFSLNPDFDVFGGGGAFDADLEGLYDVRLRVSDDQGETVAEASIQVIVVDTLPADANAATLDLSLSASESLDPVVIAAGNPGALTYSTTLQNAGPLDATNAQASQTFTLPAGVTLDGPPSATVGSVSGAAPTFTWDVPNLASGSSAVLTAQLTVADSAALGDDVIAAVASLVTVDQPDRNAFNQTASVATSIACNDADFDGVCDEVDNCPADANPLQTDFDGDGNGDACDLCFGDDLTGDSDLDGVCDSIDFCRGDDLTGDADMDGLCASLDCDEGDPSNACLLFIDDFETGDTTLWAQSVGEAP